MAEDRLEKLTKKRERLAKELSVFLAIYKTDACISPEKAISMHTHIEVLEDKIQDIDNEIEACKEKIAKDVEPEYDMVGVKYPRAKKTECSGAVDALEALTKLRNSIAKNLDEVFGSSFKYDYNSWTNQSYIEELKKVHSIDNEIARISRHKDSGSDMVEGKYPRAKKTESSSYTESEQKLNLSDPFPSSDSKFHMYIDDGEVKLRIWNGSEYVDIVPADKKEDESNKNETQNVIFNADSYELLSNPKENTTYIDTRGGKLRIWNGSEYVNIEPYDETAYIKTLEEEVKSLREKLNDIKEYNSDKIRTDENGCIIW